MKNFRPVILMIVYLAFLFCSTSCVVFSKGDNGRHKGWQKNPNNPHHQNSTKPGKSKGKSKNSTSKCDFDFLVNEVSNDQ